MRRAFFTLRLKHMGDVLDEAANEVAGHKVPNLRGLYELGLPRHPTLDAMHFLNDPESAIPSASVCLNDALHMLEEARFALIEGFKQLAHYREKSPPNEPAAVFFGRFYGADVALRLYAAGEHIANAIVKMLAVAEDELAACRKNRISLQAMVADFMRSEKPGHLISNAIQKLGTSREWKSTMDYRNLWVHEQAPLVSGIGLTFKRGKQAWHKISQARGTGYELTFGGGDEPEISVDELLEFVCVASCLVEDLLAAIAGYYLGLLPASVARTSPE